MSPPGVKESDPPLEAAAKASLGNLSPQAGWELVKAQMDNALEHQPEQCEQISKELNLPVDETDLLELLELMNPVKGVNELLYINPSLKLESLQKLDPLEVYRAVLRVLTLSDRYQAMK